MSEVLISKYRYPGKGWRIVTIAFPAIAIILALIVIFHWTPFGIVLIEISYQYLLMAALLPLAFLYIPFSKSRKSDAIPWYDILLIVLSVAIPAYFISNEYEILSSGWSVGNAPDFIVFLSVIQWLLLLEAGRRCAGPWYAGTITLFSIYPLFAQYMPGFLWGPNLSLRHLAGFHALSQESIMGVPIHIFASMMIGFMVFAVVIQGLGAGKFFNDLALAFVGKTRASNAKVAILASAFFGTVSGSGVANVMTTGCFTIPAMKKEGLPGYFAGAVEACASSGGILMPPVMGATAFIMAEFLEIPYAQVALVAAIPSVLYYWTLFVQIDAYAGKIQLKPAAVLVAAPPVWRTLLNHFHILVSFVVLVLLMFLFRLEAQGAWLAIVVMVILAMVRKETRLNLRSSLKILEDIGKVLGELVSLMGSVGLLVGGFIITGLAYSLPHEIVSMAGGNIPLMLVFGAVASFVLGLGVTVSACYIFLAIVLAPSLVSSGIDIMAAHLFVLYWGVMSEITPPVGMAFFAGAMIAEADPMKTGFQAMKLGVAKYVLPFVFVLSPAIILRGNIIDTLQIVPLVAIGLSIVGAALEGYFWRLGELTILARILFIVAGVLILDPTLSVNLYGLGIFAATFAIAYLLRGKNNLLVLS